MAVKKQGNAPFTCAENIAMLYLLHTVPEMPSTNSQPEAQFQQSGRSLPFAEERRLAGMLAFLAQIEDDPHHIPAVCLQEGRKKRALNILLAVNRSRPEDGRAYVSKIKDGFERLATMLRATDEQSANLEGNIFASIIDMCQKRILSRMRFAKKLKDLDGKKRVTVSDGLRPVVEYLNQNQSESSKLLLDRSRHVLRLATSWLKHQAPQELVELVEGVNTLRHTPNLKEAILESNLVGGPSAKSHLLNMIRKLSRYRESASILVEMAREFPLVREMQVIVVELPGDAFDRPTISQAYHPTINSTISRLQGLKKKLRDPEQMCNLLKISIQMADTRYDAQVKQTLKNSKIHAEIQLLFYCQAVLNGACLPRVVCSSKSACWLCNSFIQVHGKLYTPRSHGRLYPGWRLPNLHDSWSTNITARFNRSLESTAVESLKTLFQRREKTTYVDPLESELSTIIWPLSQPRLSANISSREPLGQLATILDQIDSTSLVRVGKTAKDAVVLGKETPAEDVTVSSLSSESSDLTVDPSAPGRICSPLKEIRQDEREKSTSYELVLGEISPILPSGPLKLQFEYSGGSRQGQHEDLSKQLSCKIEWLSQEEFRQLGLDDSIVINTEHLTGDEFSLSTDASNNIYLGLEDAVLRLTMEPMLLATDDSGKTRDA
ncbi:hypothetical protein F5Y14DRAFT_423178 [Nemania sp. NC0429]|nr:hypothetical protein F5Y14DRAFT_423178 [Nemania sp. NC0429]